jgi:hypothetical protein
MIKTRSEIKAEMMEEISIRFDKYIDEMEKGSKESKFSIDKIENLLGSVISDSKQIILDKTAELLKTVDESAEISKKN